MKALTDKGIRATAQRVAVAEFILTSKAHPSAEQVFAGVAKRFRQISRATVYNTLNLFLKKGLLRALTLAEGLVVFDPMVERHHHFISEASGQIYDIPWDALSVRHVDALEGFDVSEYQVVLRGNSHKEKRK